MGGILAYILPNTLTIDSLSSFSVLLSSPFHEDIGQEDMRYSLSVVIRFYIAFEFEKKEIFGINNGHPAKDQEVEERGQTSRGVRKRKGDVLGPEDDYDILSREDQQRRPTVRIGKAEDPSCRFCGGESESGDHLVFDCER